MKAVKNFKRLVDPAKGGAGPTMQSILGGDAQFVAPPMEMDESEDFPEVGLGQSHGSHGLKPSFRRFLGRPPMSALRRDHTGARPRTSDSASMSSRPEHSPASSRLPSGVFEPERRDSNSIRSGRSGRAEERSESPKFSLSRASSSTTKRSIEGTRGHARDPLEENWSYLSIGPSTYTGTSKEEEVTRSDPVPIFAEPDSTEEMDLSAVDEPIVVSESPGAADFDIYETAYGKELERIQSEITQPSAGAGASTGTGPDTEESEIPGPKVYLTRRVEGKEEVMKYVKDKTLNLQVGQKFSSPMRGPSTAFGAAVSMLRNQIQQQKEQFGREEQRQASEHNQAQAQQHERRGSHPYSSASIPEPEPSALEATGTHTDAPGDSTVQLRRLLGKVRDKSGE